MLKVCRWSQLNGTSRGRGSSPAEARDVIADHGKIRVLFEMRDFHGWEAGALWEDVKFDFKHFSDIERAAMVGDKTWEKWMATFCFCGSLSLIIFLATSQFASTYILESIG